MLEIKVNNKDLTPYNYNRKINYVSKMNNTKI